MTKRRVFLRALLLAVVIGSIPLNAQASAIKPLTIPKSTVSGHVVNAVVGNYWVTSQNNQILSQSLKETAAPKMVVENDAWLFHVWGDRVLYYARPEEGKPYRMIRNKPDASARSVIEKRQGEFLYPIGVKGDVCYANVGKIVKYDLSRDRVTALGFSVKGDTLGLTSNNRILAINWSNKTITAYTLEGKMTTLFTPGDQIRSAIYINDAVFVETRTKGSFLVLSDGKIRKLSDGAVSSTEAWAYTPDYVLVKAAPVKDAAGKTWSCALVGREGVYPMESLSNAAVTGDGKGNAVMAGVDRNRLIGIANYPVVK